MIGFIQRIWHLIVGDIQAAVNWLVSLISAVYTYVDRGINVLWNQIVANWHYFYNLAVNIGHWIDSVWLAIWGILNHTIPNLWAYILALIKQIEDYIRNLNNRIIQQLDRLIKTLNQFMRDIQNWVINDIWKPLMADIAGILHWITHEGAHLWYMITHPDALVKLLAKWLWLEWLNLLRRYGRTIARYLLTHMLGLASELVPIAEEIISKLL